YPIATFSPSTWPVSFRPWRNARSRSVNASGDTGWKNPTTGIAGCCARAASGQTATPLPRSAINSRRLMGAYPKAKDHEPILARCIGQKACRRSVRLDAGIVNHLAPLLSFVRDELAEVGSRAWKCGGAPLGKPRLHVGIGKSRVDLRVELVDDFGGRALRCA